MHKLLLHCNKKMRELDGLRDFAFIHPKDAGTAETQRKMTTR